VCAGSYLLNARYPDESGDEADEGTVAHEYASDHLLKGTPLDQIPDVEMFRAVSLYTQTCRGLVVDDGMTGVEDSFEIDVTGLAVTGTTDFFSWGPDNTLTIADFKYGHGWVEVRMNWQLITYAVLMWLKYGNGTMPLKVRLIVVQPRANHPDGPIRSWEFDGELLRNYRNQIQNQITKAVLEGASTCADKECRYCPSILDCHTNRAAIADAIDFAGSASASDISGSALAHELEMVKRAVELITHRHTALESYALEHVRGGGIIPGYRAAQAMSALQWDIKDPIAAGNDINISLAKKPQAVTPTQALNSKLLTKEQVALMASRKLGAFKLKRENLTFAKELVKNT